MLKWCSRWLVIFSVYLIVLGFTIAVFPQSRLVKYIFNNQIDSLFWINNEIPANFIHYQSWIYGLLGATITGWGMIMFFTIRYAFAKHQKWAWKSLLIGFTIWFCIDTPVSIIYHVYFNVLFNSILYIAVLLPLILTYSSFFKKI